MALFYTLVGAFAIFWFTCAYLKFKASTYSPVVKLQLGSKIGILVTSTSVAREVLRDQDIVFANRDIVFANRDVPNTAKMLSSATLEKAYELRRRVLVQTAKLVEVVGKDNLVKESHIHKLPYLLAIMKESLRLHPILPLLVPHCSSEPCTVGGYAIPKGSRVFVNAWAIHRDPSIRKNSLEFNPSRFLNGQWDFNGSDFSYFPFGSGRRICAGIAMAERMVLYSVATLLHSFDWKVPEGKKLDLSEKFGIVLKLENPLVAIPTPRLSDPSLYE
ncbi:Flavonoid 3',5'-hydroxylase 1 [Hibiscus syriacus]|uniref:Flavonoid 3',5'-hydroxylase 1 n=1 Tax=Hibiscus syriacus TaxID=106335 RepID=A0A6A2XTW7_HIBSY|nr:Flavonoid 3',5'-hydroxylase 1 [Hibiscus syriacus]